MSSALSRPLYPPHGHIEPPHHRLRRCEHVSFRWRDYRCTVENSVAVTCPSRPRKFTASLLPACLAQGFLYASATTACSRIVIANNCFPWRALLLAAQGREPLPLPPAAGLRSPGFFCPRCGAPMRDRFSALHRRTTLFRSLGLFMNVATPIRSATACLLHARVLNRVLTRYHHHSKPP